VSGKLFFDDFTRPSIGPGYVAEGINGEGWSIVANRLRYTSTSDNGQAYLRNTAFTYGADAVYEYFFTYTASATAPRLALQKGAGTSGSHYLLDTGHGTSTDLIRYNGTYAGLVSQPTSYVTNTSYRLKAAIGQGTGRVRVWRNEVLAGIGNESQLLPAGNFVFHVGNFLAGGVVEYDNIAVYKSTTLTVNGPYGSWALYANNGTVRIGGCNTMAVVDFAAVTSFPADYANGSAAQIKVFPAGTPDCSGIPTATFVGTAGNEIFGGDVFTFTSGS
jgi:hypothetical protein